MSTLDQLFQAAKAVRERAHVPYSRYQVGAAIRDETGRIHAGCNVENAAYPQGQCAEASAIGIMVAAGGKRIAEIVVIGAEGPLCTPCGGCRQRIREFASQEVAIHCGDPSGILRRFTLGELLPHSFGPDHLGGA